MAIIGASFADFVYVFAAVYGLTRFYSVYKPYIPYVLLVGTVFLFFLGYKISKTKIDLTHMDDKNPLAEKIAEKHWNGFWAGFMLNFLNPTLFLGWLSSSFIIFSLVSALGFNTGGLDQNVYNSYTSVNTTPQDSTPGKKALSYFHLDSLKVNQHAASTEALTSVPKYFPVLLSASYAFFLSLGSIIWFYYLVFLLEKYRHRLNINTVNRIIRLLGWILFLLGFLLGYKAIKMFS